MIRGGIPSCIAFTEVNPIWSVDLGVQISPTDGFGKACVCVCVTEERKSGKVDPKLLSGFL